MLGVHYSVEKHKPIRYALVNTKKYRNVIFKNMHIMLVNIAKLRTVAPKCY